MATGCDNKRLRASFQRPSRGLGWGGVNSRLANVAIGHSARREPAAPPARDQEGSRHAARSVQPRAAQPCSAPSHCSRESANHAKRTGTHVKLV